MDFLYSSEISQVEYFVISFGAYDNFYSFCKIICWFFNYCSSCAANYCIQTKTFTQ